MTGIIKNFNTDKNYGFIYCGDNEIFYHISGFVDKSIIPEEGMSVSFEVEETAKGKQARKICIISKAKIGTFIKFGDELIPITSIENVKVKNESSEYINDIKIRDEMIFNLENKIENTEIEIAYNMRKKGLDMLISDRDNALKSIEYQLALEGKLEYIYVTTKKNKIHKFFPQSCGFDLREKLQELENR